MISRLKAAAKRGRPLLRPEILRAPAFLGRRGEASQVCRHLGGQNAWASRGGPRPNTRRPCPRLTPKSLRRRRRRRLISRKRIDSEERYEEKLRLLNARWVDETRMLLRRQAGAQISPSAADFEAMTIIRPHFHMKKIRAISDIYCSGLLIGEKNGNTAAQTIRGIKFCPRSMRPRAKSASQFVLSKKSDVTFVLAEGRKGEHLWGPIII